MCLCAYVGIKKMNAVRWNLAISPETDQSLRLFLASNNSGRKGDLSKFVEEAVRIRIFDLTAAQLKTANQNIEEEDLNSVIHEAILWAREQQ